MKILCGPTHMCENKGATFSGGSVYHHVLAGEGMAQKESPFACDMTAIAPEQRGAHMATIEKLFRSVRSKRELPDGYAFELPNDSDMLLTAAQFISLERLCCPFFGFELQVEREGGSVWLSLTGRGGVKPFILAEIGEHLPVSIQTINSVRQCPVSPRQSTRKCCPSNKYALTSRSEL